MMYENINNPIKKLIKVFEKDERLIIGLMSGTSADGVSVVLTKIKGSGISTSFRILAYNTYPYPIEIKKMIFNLFNPKTSTVDKICLMNFILGEIFADACIKIVNETKFKLKDIDLIGSHGQTIYHIPKKEKINGYSSKSTLQIGEPSVIAEKTGVITVADFRTRDVAAGGEGAPIIPYVDYILFSKMKRNIVVQNIGGIANLTYIPKGASIDDIIAFDTGPGNMVIDGIINIITSGKLSYDPDGKIASKGKVSKKFLEELMSHPFLHRKPPKTTGREEFGEKFINKIYKYGKKLGLKNEDIVATVTAFTAESIVLSYKQFIKEHIDEVIIGGGGSFNKTLIKMIKERLPGVKISFHEDYDIPAQAKEPLGMAILANETISGNSNNVPSATGAIRRVIMGKIILGK